MVVTSHAMGLATWNLLSEKLWTMPEIIPLHCRDGLMTIRASGATCNVINRVDCIRCSHRPRYVMSKDLKEQKEGSGKRRMPQDTIIPPDKSCRASTLLALLSI